MSPPVTVLETGHTSLALYRRPSRLRRLAALLLTASGALGVACGGGDDEQSADDPGQVWVESDGASGRINMDDVQQAYRDAYSAESFDVTKFEQRVNEIYEGDHVVLVQVQRDGDKVNITGWEDLNGDKTLDESGDDKLFTITQNLNDGNFETRGHGANGYYSNNGLFTGFFGGLLLGNLLSGGRTTYVTTPSRYDDVAASRASYRNGGGYASQQARNASFGNGLPSRFGNAAGTQSVSPARSSYQSRQINSGGFRSSGSGSRSIGSGARGGTSGGGGGLTGGGGRLTL